MKKLVLIDSNAIIHRAYHALPRTLSTKKGELTNAVYGFTTTLIKVLEDLKPDYIAASFDVSKATFRLEQYAQYKAHRVEADQELYDQIPRVKELLSAFNIPIYELEGYEADDVIGTIVKMIQDTRDNNQINSKFQGSKQTTPTPLLKNEGKGEDNHSTIQPFNPVTVYIVTGDKDLFQLLNGEVFVYWLKKGLSESQVVGSKEIREIFNLDPHDFIDLKALAGDPSDNIPGVPNIGNITATKLLQQFDTLDKLYGKIAQLLNCSIADLPSQQFNNETMKQFGAELNIRPRILELLITNYEQAKLSQKLATIHKEVPIEFDLKKAEWGEYDKDKVRELFQELRFVSLLRRFGVVESAPPKTKEAQEQKKKDEQLKLL